MGGEGMDIPKAITEAIQKELARAKAKFPWWPVDPIHAAAIVNEEAGELIQAALQFTYEEGTHSAMFDEAVQVAAMAIRFIENTPEYREVKSKRTRFSAE
jgi:NTP pyrophosphatase (non-canonical NTP hydrolase)